MELDIGCHMSSTMVLSMTLSLSLEKCPTFSSLLFTYSPASFPHLICTAVFLAGYAPTTRATFCSSLNKPSLLPAWREWRILWSLPRLPFRTEAFFPTAETLIAEAESFLGSCPQQDGNCLAQSYAPSQGGKGRVG